MGAASSSSSSPSRPTPTDAAGGGANPVPALQGCATSSPSVWHGWGHGSGRAELAPSCSLLEIPCWWRSPHCPLPPPGSPHLYCLPLGSVPDSAEPRGGTQVPWGTRCPASLLQTPGFVATQAVLEQTQLEVALAVISHEITGLGGGGQGGDSDQGGSCRGCRVRPRGWGWSREGAGPPSINHVLK